MTRFAPSPTGYLHLGHAASALIGWQRAREAGGRFLLRLEDIDPTRCRPAFAAAILEDLAWLGLDWDGPVRVQSAHLPDYECVLNDLRHRALLYPCFCTRAAIQREIAESAAAPHAPDGSLRYPGTCRALSADERHHRITSGDPHVWRLDVTRAMGSLTATLRFEEEGHGTTTCQPELFGDPVLARRDSPASYHLCVTHDDAVQGVTLVTRGEDLLAATDLHRMLQALMGWPAPRYAHHRLLTDPSGRRFAKRDGAVTLRTLRTQGYTAEDVRRLAQSQ